MTAQEQVMAIMLRRNSINPDSEPYTPYDFELVRDWPDDKCAEILSARVEGMQAAMICIAIIQTYVSSPKELH